MLGLVLSVAVPRGTQGRQTNADRNQQHSPDQQPSPSQPAAFAFATISSLFLLSFLSLAMLSGFLMPSLWNYSEGDIADFGKQQQVAFQHEQKLERRISYAIALNYLAWVRK
jgi:hypothetical protein